MCLGGTLLRASRLLVTAAAIVLVGAACTSSARHATYAAATGQINALRYDKVPQGGNLNFPIAASVVNFNPSAEDGDNANTTAIVSPMLPSMFTSDASDGFQYNPDYLASEPAVGQNPQRVTYELNSKAAWSDGAKMSYNDFVGMWKANNGTDTRFKFATTQGYDAISSVARGQNAQEVVVTFKRPYADWRGLFSLLLPASVTSDPVAFNTGWRKKPLVSAGPFMYDSADPATASYKVVPNPTWWGRTPRLASITYHVIAPGTQVDALAARQIDFMDVGPDAATYARVKALPGIDVRVAGGPDYRHITFNASSSTLSDVRVRQALAMGINRTAIARAMLGPLGVSTPTALNNHVFMANQQGYQDNSGAVGKYDPSAAAAKLTTVGWLVKGDDRVKGGKTLDLHLVIPDGVSASASEASLIQQQLATIQVKVTIEPVSSSTFFTNYIQPGKYDLTVFSWLGSAFPIISAAALYANEAGGDWGRNFARVGSDAIDADFKKAEADADPPQAEHDANAADALIWQEVHSLPTYQRPDIWACNEQLVNFGAFGFASIDYTAIGFAS